MTADHRMGQAGEDARARAQRWGWRWAPEYARPGGAGAWAADLGYPAVTILWLSAQPPHMTPVKAAESRPRPRLDRLTENSRRR
jgi:hypothetical protein